MFKNQIIKATQIFMAALTLQTMIACSKDQNQFVPYVQVSQYININLYNHLTIPGNSITFTQIGYAGIIVMCVNPSQYYAFDACCPYETLPTCSVGLDPIKSLSSVDMIFSSSVWGKCKCCGSEYSLFGGGYATKGPSSHVLQQYQVSLIGGMLWIHN